MITVIALFLVITGVIAAIVDDRSYDYSNARDFIKCFCVLAGTLVIIADIIFFGFVIRAPYIDEQIEMYETENALIETKTAETVNAYLEHESKIQGTVAEKINPESAISVIAAFPELNSSDIVAKQIEVYKSNNDEIKKLKTEKITAKVYKFLVYFGGGE